MKRSDGVATTSKKDQIISLFREAGVTRIEELAWLTDSTPSYIAQVLREAQVLSGYFDLYTSSERPMNVYSRFFAKKLGFKDIATAERSVHYINTLYTQFGRIGDHAGQHHALLMALTMRNRAVWSNKMEEAAVFARWLAEKIAVPEAETMSPATQRMERYLAKNEHALTPARRKYLRG
jgi:hypothetical protein